MRTFTFATTAELDAYFDKVVDVMLRDFGVSEEEAVGRVNRTFGGHDVLADTTLTHEWAKDTALPNLLRPRSDVRGMSAIPSCLSQRA